LTPVKPGSARRQSNDWAAEDPSMPWTEIRYPASMKRLAPRVRAKAIEIANALLEEGHDEGMAIRVAIAQAKAWAVRQRFASRARDR